MTIEFSRKDLDYLAEKIAERLNGESKPTILANPFDNMTVREVIENQYACISVRLLSILGRNFPGWTMKQLAGVKWRDYKRVRGMGAKSYNELCLFFEKLNYKPGWNRLKYDYETSTFSILER